MQRGEIERIVFWEPTVSPHKSDFFKALAAAAPALEVVCCAHGGVAPDRRALGWRVDSDFPYRTIIAPSSFALRSLAAEQPDTTLHVFSGIRHIRTIVKGLRMVRRAGARFAIQSEPRAFEGGKGVARYLQSWLTESELRKNASFVLAIGRNGPPWFRSVGYSQTQVFPFAYFVDPPDSNPSECGDVSRNVGPTRIGYVGRLVAMKGVFDLADAIAQLGEGFTLALAGTGVDEAQLLRYCAQRNVSVDFAGVLPMAAIGDFMRDLDVLVLASRSSDDGWGVVVSEALMCGTAVVATSCVGASVMLSENSFGRMTHACSGKEIAEAVGALVASGALLSAARSRRAALAKARLSADVGARYFLEIVRWSKGGCARPRPFYERETSDEPLGVRPPSIWGESTSVVR